MLSLLFSNLVYVHKRDPLGRIQILHIQTGYYFAKEQGINSASTNRLKMEVQTTCQYLAYIHFILKWLGMLNSTQDTC